MYIYIHVTLLPLALVRPPNDFSSNHAEFAQSPSLPRSPSSLQLQESVLATAMKVAGRNQGIGVDWEVRPYLRQPNLKGRVQVTCRYVGGDLSVYTG